MNPLGRQNTFCVQYGKIIRYMFPQDIPVCGQTSVKKGAVLIGLDVSPQNVFVAGKVQGSCIRNVAKRYSSVTAGFHLFVVTNMMTP